MRTNKSLSRKEEIERLLDEKTLEIEELTNQIEKLEDELYELKNYDVYVETAAQMKGIHDAFVYAGFTDEQAYEIILNIIFSSNSGVSR